MRRPVQGMRGRRSGRSDRDVMRTEEGGGGRRNDTKGMNGGVGREVEDRDKGGREER